MKRTTILADEETLLYLRHLAERRHDTLTSVIKEALAEYVAKHAPPKRRVSITGIGRSGESDVSERDEEILENELGDYGWEGPPRTRP